MQIRDIQIREGTIEELSEINARIEEFTTPYGLDELRSRLTDRVWYGLVASNQNQLLGFKVGYAESEDSFYSWLGGVVPEARRLGLAREMLHAQEAWVIGQGCQQIRVKSRNRYPGMLQLLLSEHYLVTDIESKADALDHRIWFTKSLVTSN